MNGHPAGTERFYDSLSADYRFLHRDWERSVGRQSAALDGLIRKNFGDGIRSILDASCGIGTQLIGLAERGYAMSGSDISRKELAAAGRELRTRGLTADLRRADFRKLGPVFRDRFDLVISCDNALPHCLSDREILKALRSMAGRARAGLLITIRDYDAVDRNAVHLLPYGYRTIGGKRTYLFQRWEFKGEIYTISFFFLREGGTGAVSAVRGKVFRTEYYAIRTDRMKALMERAGLRRVKIIKKGFFQPVFLGWK